MESQAPREKKKVPTVPGAIVVVSGAPAEDAEWIAEIENSGREVTVCQEPRRALTLFDNKPSTWKAILFIIDVILPQESSYELVRRIVDKFSDKKIPVAMMSRYVANEDKLESSNAGAIVLLQKPVTAKAINDILERERIKKLKSEIGGMVFDISYE